MAQSYRCKQPAGLYQFPQSEVTRSLRISIKMFWQLMQLSGDHAQTSCDRRSKPQIDQGCLEVLKNINDVAYNFESQKKLSHALFDHTSIFRYDPEHTRGH